MLNGLTKLLRDSYQKTLKASWLQTFLFWVGWIALIHAVCLKIFMVFSYSLQYALPVLNAVLEHQALFSVLIHYSLLIALVVLSPLMMSLEKETIGVAVRLIILGVIGFEGLSLSLWGMHHHWWGDWMLHSYVTLPISLGVSMLMMWVYSYVLDQASLKQNSLGFVNDTPVDLKLPHSEVAPPSVQMESDQSLSKCVVASATQP